MEQVNNSVESKKKCIKRSIAIAEKRIQNITLKFPKNTDQEIIDSCNQVTDNLKKSINAWMYNFDKILIQQKFRDEFTDSFLVIIYGKVKAGKSSFGNFVAKNTLSNQKANFFVYDSAGNDKKHVAKLEEIDEDNFEVKRTEATNSIQGFKLSGLTWIDTPGLSSMTKENGDLAKEYIESADFIIYPISSDAPGRATDIKEILELFKKNKPVSILITKSDKTIRKVVNGKVVGVLQNKSSEDRKKQEAYVLNEILSKIPTEKRYLIDKEIYSISTKTASVALQTNDPVLYNESNMDIFYSRMFTLLNDHAIDLNIKAPNSKIRTFVDEIVIGSDSSNTTTLYNIKLLLKEIDSKRIDSLSEIKQIMETFKEEIVSDVEFEVDKIYMQLNQNNVTDLLNNVFKNIEDKVSQKMTKEISKVLQSFDKSLFSIQMGINSDEFQIKDEYSKIVYDDSQKKKGYGEAIVGGIGAILTTFAISQFWNPSGWIAGGLALVVDVAVTSGASYIGGEIGKTMGEEKEENVVVGDNKNKIIYALKITLIEEIERNIRATIDSLDKAYFIPIANFSIEARKVINKIEIEMKGCTNDRL